MRQMFPLICLLWKKRRGRKEEKALTRWHQWDFVHSCTKGISRVTERRGAMPRSIYSPELRGWGSRTNLLKLHTLISRILLDPFDCYACMLISHLEYVDLKSIDFVRPPKRHHTSVESDSVLIPRRYTFQYETQQMTRVHRIGQMRGCVCEIRPPRYELPRKVPYGDLR
jgi:hypothetical protein